MALSDWAAFAREHDLENRLFDWTQQSLALIAQVAWGEPFSAFAFTCSAYYGDIVLSLATDPEVKAHGDYPPDWRYEVIAQAVPAVAELWQREYDPIAHAFLARQDAHDEAAFAAFAEGFLDTLRRVMVRLERQQAFARLSTTPEFWTLVTEVDADTDEEECLLAACRQQAGCQA